MTALKNLILALPPWQLVFGELMLRQQQPTLSPQLRWPLCEGIRTCFFSLSPCLGYQIFRSHLWLIVRSLFFFSFHFLFGKDGIGPYISILFSLNVRADEFSKDSYCRVSSLPLTGVTWDPTLISLAIPLYLLQNRVSPGKQTLSWLFLRFLLLLPSQT